MAVFVFNYIQLFKKTSIKLLIKKFKIWFKKVTKTFMVKARGKIFNNLNICKCCILCFFVLFYNISMFTIKLVHYCF